MEIDAELTEIAEELNEISRETTFNAQQLLDGTSEKRVFTLSFNHYVVLPGAGNDNLDQLMCGMGHLFQYTKKDLACMEAIDDEKACFSESIAIIDEICTDIAEDVVADADLVMHFTDKMHLLLGQLFSAYE